MKFIKRYNAVRRPQIDLGVSDNIYTLVGLGKNDLRLLHVIQTYCWFMLFSYTCTSKIIMNTDKVMSTDH